MLKILPTSFISQFFLEEKIKGKERKPLLCNILKLTKSVLLQEPSVAELLPSAKDVAQVSNGKKLCFKIKSNQTVYAEYCGSLLDYKYCLTPWIHCSDTLNFYSDSAFLTLVPGQTAPGHQSGYGFSTVTVQTQFVFDLLFFPRYLYTSVTIRLIPKQFLLFSSLFNEGFLSCTKFRPTSCQHYSFHGSAVVMDAQTGLCIACGRIIIHLFGWVQSCSSLKNEGSVFDFHDSWLSACASNQCQKAPSDSS